MSHLAEISAMSAENGFGISNLSLDRPNDVNFIQGITCAIALIFMIYGLIVSLQATSVFRLIGIIGIIIGLVILLVNGIIYLIRVRRNPSHDLYFD